MVLAGGRVALAGMKKRVGVLERAGLVTADKVVEQRKRKERTDGRK
jgi:hypothetical protein